uniref:Cycle n=1 Tax=Sesamia nonagrioides TaxID=236805 RepID=Q2PRP1_9NEOP|nr:cycle [Sesamia nonagrioides]
MADFSNEPKTSQCDQASASAAPAYELTAGGGGACAESPGTLAHAQHPPPMQQSSHHHDPRKRKTSQYSESYDVSSCDAALGVPPAPMHVAASATRKRKPSSYGTASAYDDDGDDGTRSTRTLPDKKQNHSEIEKHRRDRMNTYISELSAMIPMCGAMARKLDKLTVLRMAVQHMRTVRGAQSACPLSARPRPAFLSERELNQLVLHAAQDSFLLVVGCDRGRLLYVSTSVKQILLYDQSELLGQSLFDILHPKDVAKVKEQLSSSHLSPRETLIDAKTMLPLKTDVQTSASRLCPGARRSFFCRIKYKAAPETQSEPAPIKEETEPSVKPRKKTNEKKYCVVQCTGYLKSWAPAELSEAGPSEAADDSDASSMSCLVLVGRAMPGLAPQPPQPPLASAPVTRQLQYVSRHTPDGKFIFVDQRVTLALGFLPQELLGTSLYEYVREPELGGVARAHKAALLRREPLRTPIYTFRRKDGSLARLQTHFKPFRNPWTKDVECLVANNTVVSDAQKDDQADDAHASYDMYKQKAADVEMQRLIESQVESHKIGSAIAEEALRSSSVEFVPELSADLLQDAVFNQNVRYILSSGPRSARVLARAKQLHVQNIVNMSVAGVSTADFYTSIYMWKSRNRFNDEAAMAVIMSLLEADAGLKIKSLNFSGLPWPLP